MHCVVTVLWLLQELKEEDAEDHYNTALAVKGGELYHGGMTVKVLIICREAE